MIGPGILVPLVVVAVVVPTVIWYVRSRTRPSPAGADRDPAASASRLTSVALYRLAAPRWRVVLEVPADRLGGVEHVLIGPPGIFAVTTELSPLAPPSDEPPSATELAGAAVIRAELDDALARCALRSTAHVIVHWGRTDVDDPAVDNGHGAVAVDGHRFAEWAEGLGDAPLTASQVDLAWQTVCLAIGRPDPLG